MKMIDNLIKLTNNLQEITRPKRCIPQKRIDESFNNLTDGLEGLSMYIRSLKKVIQAAGLEKILK